MALGLNYERLPHSPKVRSTVWTYFADYETDAVFMGDEPARLPVVTLQIYVLAGGLDETGKRRLIEGATAILDRRPDGTAIAPVLSSFMRSQKRIGESSASKPTWSRYEQVLRMRQQYERGPIIGRLQH